MKPLIIVIFSLVSLAIYSQESIIGAWDQSTAVINKTVIVDILSNFNLTKCVSLANGIYSGYEASYSPSLDIRGVSFIFEGIFRTKGKANGVMAIAGNRSGISVYTGWDFVMLSSGELRFLACANGEKARSMTSIGQRFDDDLEHNFLISFDAVKKKVTMTIDKLYTYSTLVTPNLKSHSGRRFYIGAQPTTTGGKTILFKGQLKNFIFRGTYVPPSLEDMDENMGTDNPNPTVKWIDAKTLTIEGMGWSTESVSYTRLPNIYRSEVSSFVWDLSRQTSGIVIHFNVIGTTSLSAKWTLQEFSGITHMTSLAANGLDLYVKIDGQWVWAGLGKPEKTGLLQESILRNGFSASKSYECKLYLPLYAGVSSLQIGVSLEATINPVSVTKKPIVFYGTSTVQGCSATRSGMSYPAQLGRWFDCPINNFGFTDNGLMEAYFVPILAGIDASVYVIDCLSDMVNISPVEVKKRAFVMVRNLRCLRPEVPIILMESRQSGYIDLLDDPYVLDKRDMLRSVLKECYTELSTQMDNIYYVEEKQLSSHGSESLVDNDNPSDLGLYDYCKGLESLLSKILNIKPIYSK